MAERPRRTKGAKSLRLACWNAECAVGSLNWSTVKQIGDDISLK